MDAPYNGNKRSSEFTKHFAEAVNCRLTGEREGRSESHTNQTSNGKILRGCGLGSCTYVDFTTQQLHKIASKPIQQKHKTLLHK